MKIAPDSVPDLANMDADALRQLVLGSMARQQALQDELRYKPSLPALCGRVNGQRR